MKYARPIIICTVLLLVIGALFYWHASKPKQEKPVPQKAHKQALPKEVTITLNKNGFEPKEITIQTGSAVRWKNASGAKQTVNSDNYPTNRLHRELNFGVFDSGSSVVHVFTKKGTYGFHNQFSPEQKGQIVVK